MSNMSSKLSAGELTMPEWSQPKLIPSDDPTGEVDRLFDSEAVNVVYDRLDLIEKDMTEAHLHNSARQDIETKTNWVYFPWDKSLVRYPNAESYHALRTYRNRPLLSTAEQQRVRDARIAFIGLSVGSKVVEQVLESGTGNSYLLADPDVIDYTNLNRISANAEDVGEAKVSFVAKKISKKDPYIGQLHAYDGYVRATEEDLDEFNPQILFDEVDDLAAKAMIRLYAAERGVPVIMITDLGEKSIVDVERYDLDGKTKPFHGAIDYSLVQELASGAELSEKDKMKAMIKITGGSLINIPPRIVQSATELKQGKIGGLPQLGRTATAGGVYADMVVQDILLNRSSTSRRSIVNPQKSLRLKRPDSLSKIVGMYRDFVRGRTA